MHISHLYAIIKYQNNCICHIKANNGDEDIMDSSDEKSVLNLYNRETLFLDSNGKAVQRGKRLLDELQTLTQDLHVCRPLRPYNWEPAQLGCCLWILIT